MKHNYVLHSFYKYLSVILILALVSACQNNAGTNDEMDAQIYERVDSVMATMNLKEKVGQMTQIAIDSILRTDNNHKIIEPFQLDTAKLRRVVVEYGVGSILNVAGLALTIDQWHSFLEAIDQMTKEGKNYIPVLYGIDAIHGANYTHGTTLFPQQNGMAATWNTSLVKEAGRITAYETRASGIPWTFSPVLDMGRNPVWPRLWETFGEDVFLTTAMGKALVEGYQGTDAASKFHVAACLKHYVGYSAPLSGKDRTPAWIPERMLREYFLPPFQAAIESGALTVMVNSAEMNGIPVHADHFVLTTILRDELKFKGLAVSDWADIGNLDTVHRIAVDKKDAVRLAINAGIDMSMVPFNLEFADYLFELVKEGKVSQTRIDEAVRRILWVKFKLGLFDNFKFPKSDYPDFASQKHRDASYATAAEAITLLKNTNNILPLNKTTKVLVVGPTANNMRALNGGWTITWQGHRTDEFLGSESTILEAIQSEIGSANVTYAQGVDFEKDIDISKAVALARQATVVIVCIGENSYTEKPGDIKDLNLSASQIDLVKQLKGTGKPIIGVLVEGRPRIINQIEPMFDGIVMGYLPGNMGGVAIADVLFGDVNPSGKLPFTYPRNPNDLVIYDHKFSESIPANWYDKGFDPQYEFGFGLSYTQFKYENLVLSTDSLAFADTLVVSVDVTNTGSRDGKEVVQLYSNDLVASITPSVRRLRGFDKIELKAGEKKTVSFKITARDLAFVAANNKWTTEAGQFELYIDKLKTSFFIY